MATPGLHDGEELTEAQVLQLLRARGARYLRLVFTDIFGVTRGMEVTTSQFEKAVSGRVLFDGSAMDGDARVEESDMLLRPDLRSLRVLVSEADTATLVCNVHRPDGSRFEGDPRGSLERAVGGLAALGLEARIAADLEFFLFRLDDSGEPSLMPYDRGGYYEVGPADRGAGVRREVLEAVEAMGIEVRAALHEVAASQHRLELAPLPALQMADALADLRVVVRSVASRHGLHASFMPKPLLRANGSGLHLHHALWRDGRNTFHDAEAREGLSDTLRQYVGGLLRHARAYCAVTNPQVNSYKRLVPDHEAPVNVAWSLHNRSPMVRIPVERGPETRCEVRIADAAANPYLALAVQIAAGVDGLREEIDPGEPINKNLWLLSRREKQRLRILELPRHLGEALDELERDRATRAALGEYIYSRFTAAKREEWLEYLGHVHPWEVRRYL
jgi:glutamine synthetase